MKRIMPLLGSNLLLVLMLSVAARLIRLQHWLPAHAGIGALLLEAALLGASASVLCLLLSTWVARSTLGVQVIVSARNPAEQWLLNVLARHARALGIGPPQAGLFDSPEPNALATGARRDAALIAVSTGLLERMSRPEIEAVLGHEITHIGSGDMLTLTVIQGVINTSAAFVAYLVGNLVEGAGLLPGSAGALACLLSVLAVQLLLGTLANLIVMGFSRWRELRADLGGARLAGKCNMIAALTELQRAHELLPARPLAACGMRSSNVHHGLQRLLMSHPPLDERIAALQSRS